EQVEREVVAALEDRRLGGAELPGQLGDRGGGGTGVVGGRAQARAAAREQRGPGEEEREGREGAVARAGRTVRHGSIFLRRVRGWHSGRERATGEGRDERGSASDAPRAVHAHFEPVAVRIHDRRRR